MSLSSTIEAASRAGDEPLVVVAKTRGRRAGTSRAWLRLALIYVLLVVGSVAFLYPFLWMLAASLRTNNQIQTSGLSIWPQQFKWSNYSQALGEFDFWRYTVNSLITTLIPIVGTVVSSSMAGFAFARMNVRGSRLAFYVVLGTMLFPGEVVMIPQFILFKQLGMIDTLYPLIVGSFFGSPFYIFMFRQFYSRLPESLTEAATLDGAGWFRMWWTIFSPLARPVSIAVAVMLFMSNWNSFMGPQIYINSNKWKTLPLGLAGFNSTYGSDKAHLMAATLVVSLPCLVLFMFSQRLFMKGAGFAGTDK
jgi:multiple sugar transport system permease protein